MKQHLVLNRLGGKKKKKRFILDRMQFVINLKNLAAGEWN